MTTIRVLIKDEKSLYEEFSNSLSQTLIDYLIQEAMIKKNIVIEVDTKTNIPNLEEIFYKGINEYYSKLVLKDKIYDVKQIIFILLGIICLITSTLLDNYLLRELLIIAGWVAIWDVIDYYLNKNMEYRREKRVLKKLMKAKIIVK